MRPGVEVNSRASRSTRGEPTDNGVWHVVDFTERGPFDAAVKVTSLDDFTRTYGERVAYSSLFDALETYFSEGGAEAYVSREVGPTPVKAFAMFDDAVAADALKIVALYAGDYANGAAGGLSAEIDNVGGGTFDVVIYFDDVEVERFAALANTTAAVAALADSDYVRGVDPGATADPVAAGPTNLAGGTDDHGTAGNDEVQEALDRLTKDLGPGQVSAPGRTSTEVHTMLIDHALTHNRTAYLDVPDKASKATMETAVRALDDLEGAEYGALWGSWFDIPGLTAGTTRAVPGSAYAAAKTARVDSLEGTSGAAAAGEASLADFALAVRVPDGGFTDADYEELNDEGVNMARGFRNRGVQMYGFRSVTNDTDWIQLTANRLRVSLTARLDAVAQRFVFRSIDGKGHVFSDLNGALAGECLKDYQAGALYGSTPEEAFAVDTGDTVNTEETIAAGEIHAVVSARFAPFAELVVIDLLKLSITSPVAA